MRRARPLMALAAMAGVLAVAAPGGSGANFNALRANPANSLKAGTISAPTGLSAVATGHDVRAAWTTGTGSASTTIEVAAADGTSCTGVTWTTLVTTSATSVLETGRHVPEGTYACYRATAVRSSWTSVAGNPTTTARIGVVATSVVFANAVDTTGCPPGSGVTGRLDCGDTVRIVFNQPIAVATGPAASSTVCTTLGGAVQFGMNGLCTSTPIVAFTGTGLSLTTKATASATWSTGNTVLTFRLTSTPLLTVALLAGPSTQLRLSTDTTKLQSETGAFHVCDNETGGAVCFPSPTGSL